jgi:hypothetical protein
MLSGNQNSITNPYISMTLGLLPFVTGKIIATATAMKVIAVVNIASLGITFITNRIYYDKIVAEKIDNFEKEFKNKADLVNYLKSIKDENSKRNADGSLLVYKTLREALEKPEAMDAIQDMVWFGTPTDEKVEKAVARLIDSFSKIEGFDLNDGGNIKALLDITLIGFGSSNNLQAHFITPNQNPSAEFLRVKDELSRLFDNVIDRKNNFVAFQENFSNDFDIDISESNIIINWRIGFWLNDMGVENFLIQVDNAEGTYHVKLLDKQTDGVSQEMDKNISEIPWRFDSRSPGISAKGSSPPP